MVIKAKRNFNSSAFRDGKRRRSNNRGITKIGGLPASAVLKLTKAGVPMHIIIKIGRLPNAQSAAEMVLTSRRKFRKPPQKNRTKTKPVSRAIGMGTKRKKTYKKPVDTPRDRQPMPKAEIDKLRELEFPEEQLNKLRDGDYDNSMLDLAMESLKKRKKKP